MIQNPVDLYRSQGFFVDKHVDNLIVTAKRPPVQRVLVPGVVP